MLQSIRRGWIFLKQGWKFGQQSPALLIPTLLSFLISFLSLVVVLLPLAGLIVYVRKSAWGQLAIGVLIGMLLMALVGVFNLFSFMTANLAGTRLKGGTPATAQAWARISELGGSLFWIAMGIPLQAFWMSPVAMRYMAK